MPLSDDYFRQAHHAFLRKGACSIRDSEPTFRDFSWTFRDLAAQVWNRVWRDKYEPTTGNPAIEGRYPPLESRSGASGVIHAIKDVVLQLFTDADTYLYELPHDDPQVKAGLIAAGILLDMVDRESSDS